MGRGEYLGELEQIVMLAVLRLGEHAYGMRIRREIEARGGRSVAIGAVYATLERLEDKRFVRTVPRPRAAADEDRRPRRFFEITRAGHDALQATAGLQTRMRAGLRLRRMPRS